MVSNSKILTVSYGTFSCTLEGFDEPFSTMKSISEYFRDLAADDRYFGAEPPTPDAEMLHRIAEREINRRVESRIDGGALVLRQTDEQATDGPVAGTALLAEDDTYDAQVTPPADLVDTSNTPSKVQSQSAPTMYQDTSAPAANDPVEPVVAAPLHAPVADPAESHAPDSIAAKLQRIRAVVDQRHDDPETEVLGDEPADDFYDEVDSPEIELNADTAFKDAEVDDEPVIEVAPVALVEDEAKADISDEDEPAASVEEQTVEIEAEAEAEIEAEVEIQTVAEIDVEDFVEEEDEADEEISASDESTQEPNVYETLLAVADDESQDDVDDNIMSGTEDYEDEEDFDGDQDDTALTTILRAVSNETAEGDDAAEVDEEDAPHVLDTALFDDEEEDKTDDGTDAPGEDHDAETMDVETEDDLTPIARIVHDEPAESAPEDNDVILLTQEDEADLMAELAEVERDSAADPKGEAEADVEDGAGAEVEAAAEVVAEAEAEIEDEDDDAGHSAFDDPDQAGANDAVDRILAETNTKLESTEVKSRRSAISHLRAAVQATRAFADSKGGAKKDEEEKHDEYRDDLARVVRPRRPEAQEKVKRRMAPLVLVTEQRVVDEDEPIEEPARPVAAIRPRRVTKGNLALDSREELVDAIADEDPEREVAQLAVDPDVSLVAQGEDFGSYLQRVKATDELALMEAAAAYVTFVQKQPHFARPQVMRMVLRQDGDKTAPREELLRAFGKLLRDGVFTKFKRGQFLISEDSRFHPDNF